MKYIAPHMDYIAVLSCFPCCLTDSPHPLIYFVAIIDILTRYGMRKRTAQTYKTVKHGADGGSVKPEFYGRRLLEFVEQCID